MKTKLLPDMKKLLLFFALIFIGRFADCQEPDFSVKIDTIKNTNSVSFKITVNVTNASGQIGYALFDKDPFDGAIPLERKIVEATAYTFKEVKKGKYFIAVKFGKVKTPIKIILLN
jgi:hypothetical protein